MEEMILERECGVPEDFEVNVIYRRDKNGKIYEVKVPDDVEEVEENAPND